VLLADFYLVYYLVFVDKPKSIDQLTSLKEELWAQQNK